MLGVPRILKIQILPLQICFADFWTGASGFLVLLVLWYFWYFGTLVFWYFVKLGFHFPEDLATEKVRSRCQIDPWGRAQLSRVIGS
jgi:hypothetical protein